MRKIRKGNDIYVHWSLTNKLGEPFDLTGLDVTIYITIFYQRHKVAKKDIVVDGNTVSFPFYGKDQRYAGVHVCELYINEGEEEMSAVDTCEAFELVDHSWEESTSGDGGDYSSISVEVVEVESSVEVNGYSPVASVERTESGGRSGALITIHDNRGVTTAMVYDGATGSQGQQGLSGNLNWPTFEIDAAMHLQMKTDTASDADHFTIDDEGHLRLII